MGAKQKCERWQRTVGTKRRVEPGLCWVMAAVRDVSPDRGSHQGKTSEKIMSGQRHGRHRLESYWQSLVGQLKQ